MKDIDRVRIAYKKLKANLYFDKTQLPLRNKVVAFEDSKLEGKLQELSDALFKGKEWDEYQKKLLNKVGVLVFPKKLESFDSDTVIFNADSTPIKMEAPQYFIDLPVEGHVLGVLWILYVGEHLDRNTDGENPKGMYEHSYGNRLRKNLINSQTGDITCSPGLFEPYFNQYESWRDYGLQKAKERLNDKQDALILTMDFKSFYYSVDINEKDFEEYLTRLESPRPWHERVNQFVFRVITTYSDALRKVIAQGAEPHIAERNILPIGFLPSNILANQILTAFDDAIIERWNPIYYGRYVDDIIIVDKVEKNSPVYKKVREKDSQQLNASDIIDLFLVKKGIFQEEKSEKGEKSYYICGELLHEGNTIGVQGKKVKLFYFRSGSTQALLNCFHNQIAQNASEFRLLPDMDPVLKHRDYSEIFKLENQESINKLHGITGMDLDKFSLSKFLGKYRKVSSLINDPQENAFEQDLMMILDERTLIANYTLWERLMEILLINDRIKLYQKMVERIIVAIKHYEVPRTICTAAIKSHDGLLQVLFSALCRTSALVRTDEMKRVDEKICEKVRKELCEDIRFSQSILNEFYEPGSAFELMRRAYCATRMINKYILPLPIDCVVNRIGEEKKEFHLYALDEMIALMDDQWNENRYWYYPYMVTPQEISFAYVCQELKSEKADFDPAEQKERIGDVFLIWNYPLGITGNNALPFALAEVEVDRDSLEAMSAGTSGRRTFMTRVAWKNTEEKTTLSVAVGNERILEENFKAALDGRPNRGYERYRRLAHILDEAVHEKVELLVLPENYLPFEWIPIVARLCADHQMAVVTGIEHIIVGVGCGGSRGQVYNLTATLLPYQHDGYNFTYISYHNKVKYSPQEKEEILGRRYTFQEGNSYELFQWHDVWFPVYCCFELTSIQDRALFQSYADVVVAVEWNKDVAYFSNIVESLSRDLHCYCIQANSSDYGDSRVVAPKETVKKDIIKTKGGRNSCILVDTIDISALRDFQVLEYSLQKAQKDFKPSPPGLDKEVIEKKRKHKLGPV